MGYSNQFLRFDASRSFNIINLSIHKKSIAFIYWKIKIFPQWREALASNTLFNGLTFTSIPQVSKCKSRFGHPSLEKLIEINKVFPFIKCVKSKFPYDVCFYSKQKRLPFPNSSTISSHCFDIVHMNSWGPFYSPSMLGYRYFLTVIDDKIFCIILSNST